MSYMKDYSEIENFNLAAIQAIRENVTEKDIGDSIKPIVSKKYKHKGRVLKATAEVTLWAYMDGEPLLESVHVISVEQVKGN